MKPINLDLIHRKGSLSLRRECDCNSCDRTQIRTVTVLSRLQKSAALPGESCIQSFLKSAVLLSDKYLFRLRLCMEATQFIQVIQPNSSQLTYSCSTPIVLKRRPAERIEMLCVQTFIQNCMTKCTFRFVARLSEDGNCGTLLSVGLLSVGRHWTRRL